MSDLIKNLRDFAAYAHADLSVADQAADEIERLREQVAALLEGLVPAGFVLVPREPDSAMLRAAAKSLSPEKRPTPHWVSCSEKHAIRYRAMIAAALAKVGTALTTLEEK